MNGFNTVVLEGVVSDDSGIDAGFFEVEYSRRYKNADGTPNEQKFKFNCEARGNVKKFAMDKLFNGRGVRIVGRLENRVRVEDGVPRTSNVVLCEHLEFKPWFGPKEDAV